MLINWAQRELSLKVVYYGPGLSGKTTNLEYLYSRMDPSTRGKMVSLKTREERTLFFDFLQVELGTIKGLKPKFNLYTVPGQVYYAYSRKIILRGVDGIVFVADSQKSRMDENLEHLLDLEENLIARRLSLETFPWVIQYNKRDLPNVNSVDYLQSKLNFHQIPSYTAVAPQGIGVVDTLKGIINEVIKEVATKI